MITTVINNHSLISLKARPCLDIKKSEKLVKPTFLLQESGILPSYLSFACHSPLNLNRENSSANLIFHKNVQKLQFAPSLFTQNELTREEIDTVSALFTLCLVDLEKENALTLDNINFLVKKIAPTQKTTFINAEENTDPNVEDYCKMLLNSGYWGFTQSYYDDTDTIISNVYMDFNDPYFLNGAVHEFTHTLQDNRLKNPVDLPEEALPENIDIDSLWIDFESNVLSTEIRRITPRPNSTLFYQTKIEDILQEYQVPKDQTEIILLYLKERALREKQAYKAGYQADALQLGKAYEPVAEEKIYAEFSDFVDQQVYLKRLV